MAQNKRPLTILTLLSEFYKPNQTKISFLKFCHFLSKLLAKENFKGMKNEFSARQIIEKGEFFFHFLSS